jgi:hypothetical protein
MTLLTRLFEAGELTRFGEHADPRDHEFRNLVPIARRFTPLVPREFPAEAVRRVRDVSRNISAAARIAESLRHWINKRHSIAACAATA